MSRHIARFKERHTLPVCLLVFIILFHMILSSHLFGGAASLTKAPCSSLMMRTENFVATSRSLVLSYA